MSIGMTNTNQGSSPVIFESDPQSEVNSYDCNSKKAPVAQFPREHEHYMPVANVIRIMRRTLPLHAKVADESKEMVQECVSEFISFITSEANETCQLEHRKTVTAEDIIGAMSRLGFDHYVQPLSIFLQRHRENELNPSIPKRNFGNMGTEATAITPTTTVFPHYPVLQPQFAMYRTASNGGTYYHGGYGMSNGPITMSRGPETTSTSTDSGGPSLALGISSGPNGPNGNDNGGPAGSIQTGLDFYIPYRHFYN